MSTTTGVFPDLTTEEKRLFATTLRESNPDLTDDDIYDAYKALHDLQTSAGLFLFWRQGKTTAGWNPQTKELTWSET